MASTDRNVFKGASAVRERMERYGSYVDGIDIVIFGALGSAVSLANGVKVHPVPGFKAIAFFRGIFLAKKILKTYAKDETIVSTQDPFELGLWGLVVSKIAGRPLHVQVHIDFFSPYFKTESFRQRFQAFLAPFILRRATAVRVVSKKIADYLEKNLKIDEKKIFIAPIAATAVTGAVTIDLHKEFPHFDFIVLVASRWVKQKNLPLAIEAFDLFAQHHPNAGLVIAGSGPEEAAIRALVEKKGLRDCVIIGSWTSEFASLMKTCDVFLLSSDYEGWDMTVVEAASCAKPIVMTDVGCASEFIHDGDNGLVVPVRDTVRMASALETIHSDRAFAARLGESARVRASSLAPSSDDLLVTSWKAAAQQLS
jgi:glycosyltransferase involved in cell wall biosynthesis